MSRDYLAGFDWDQVLEASLDVDNGDGNSDDEAPQIQVYVSDDWSFTGTVQFYDDNVVVLKTQSERYRVSEHRRRSTSVSHQLAYIDRSSIRVIRVPIDDEEDQRS